MTDPCRSDEDCASGSVVAVTQGPRRTAAAPSGLSSKSPNGAKPQAAMEPYPVPKSHGRGYCLTCSDEAVAVRVTRLLPFEFALVDTGCGGDAEEVSVALVDAAVGDTILVHAKEALAVLSQDAKPARPAPSASAPACPPASIFTLASACAVRGAVDEVYEMGGAFEFGAPGQAG